MTEMEIEDRLADLRLACWRAARKAIATLATQEPVEATAGRLKMSPKRVSKWRAGTIKDPGLEDILRVLSLLGIKVEFTIDP